jgi:diguanylate cyclase (GGDEF)-like protein/PAS domain S-box-containing protein
LSSATSGGDDEQANGSGSHRAGSDSLNAILEDADQFILADFEQLKMVLEHLPVAVFVDSSPTECLYVNRAYMDLCGLDATKLEQDQWSLPTDESARAETQDERQRLWSEGEPYCWEAEIHTVDGVCRSVATQVTPVLNAQGVVVRAIGVMVDETEHTAATAELEERERQFRALVMNSAEAVVGIDLLQRIQIWNDAASEMFGYTTEQVLGQSLSILLPPKLIGQHPSLVQGFIEGDKQRVLMRSTSVHALRSDGSTFPVEIALAKIRVGEVMLAVATVRDVTERVGLETERELIHTRYRALIQHSHDAIAIVDRAGEISYLSPSVLYMFGTAPEDIIGTSLIDTFANVHPDDRQQALDIFTSVRAEIGSHGTAVYRRLHSGGEYHHIENQITNYLDVEGLNGLVCNIRDITDEVSAKAETQSRNDELRAVLQAFPDQMYRITREGLVVESLTPDHDGFIDSGRVVGERLADLIPDPFAAKFVHTIEQVSDLQDRATLRCTENDLGSNGIRSFEIRIAPLPDGDVLASLRNITPQIQMEEQLTRQALHDDLTGLPNRAHLAAKLQEALEETAHTKGHLGVLFLDLDGFKQINDTLGHSAGDDLLIEVARRLTSAIRPHDIVARIGGDEFIIMCRELRQPEEAEAVAERVLVLLSEPIDLAGTAVTVSASIGIAVANSEGADADTLMARADAAMYRAKTRGRARAEVFDPTMRRFQSRQADMEEELAAAIAHDQLSMTYLPIIDADSGAICGLEALAQWHHPSHGVIHSDELVNIAMSADIDDKLDQAVLLAALQDTTRLGGLAETPLVVTIALSQMRAPSSELAELVLAELDAKAISPDRISLEISETDTAALSERSIEQLRRLHDAGLTLTINCFGAGEVGLSSLRSLPISQLKLDDALVADIADNDASAAIASTTIELAHHYGLRIGARTAGTPEQLDALREMGCDRIQGPAVAPALTFEELKGLLAEDRRW